MKLGHENPTMNLLSRSTWKVPSSQKPLDRLVSHLMEHFYEVITLDDMAKIAGLSKYALCRQFKRRYKASPMRWLWTFRALMAAEFIVAAPDWALTDIAFTCGYSSSAHFSRSFYAVYRVSPSEFRYNARLALDEKRQRINIKTCKWLYEDRGVLVTNAMQKATTHFRNKTALGCQQ